ncbi:hypothetical protein ACIBF7_14940 [Nonomuraea sp. NPDC050478]|uniref:hypothetical protein n=1 Tax=Nonomuraea sp. NPDC050478 TaxID=3364365 RepID=UPI0037AD4D5E
MTHHPEEASWGTPQVERRPCRRLRFEITDDNVDPVEADESVSSALALIGRITGTDLATDWFQARHSRIRDFDTPSYPDG